MKKTKVKPEDQYSCQIIKVKESQTSESIRFVGYCILIAVLAACITFAFVSDLMMR